MAARGLRLRVRTLAPAWPTAPRGIGWPCRAQWRCAPGRGPGAAASWTVRPGSPGWTSTCQSRARGGSRVPEWPGPQRGDRRNDPGACPGGVPRTWARRPPCPRSGPGARRRLPERQGWTGWACRRAGRVGWRWRGRSGARATSRLTRRRRAGRLRRVGDPCPGCRVPAGAGAGSVPSLRRLDQWPQGPRFLGTLVGRHWGPAPQRRTRQDPVAPRR
jgi:hypothetical protein